MSRQRLRFVSVVVTHTHTSNDTATITANEIKFDCVLRGFSFDVNRPHSEVCQREQQRLPTETLDFKESIAQCKNKHQYE